MVWIYALIQYLSVAIIGIGVTALSGHFLGRQVLYSWAHANVNVGAMSRPTATSTILIGVALFTIAKAHYKKEVVKTNRTTGRHRSGSSNRARNSSRNRSRRAAID